MNLFICESPNKVQSIKTILNELGLKNTLVMASVGHIIRIADTGVYNMGIDPSNKFKISYAVSKDKQEVVTKLKDAATSADIVYLATDLDREGEVIAWSLKEFLKIPDTKCKRVTYNEITKSAIKRAIDEAHEINMDLVEAGQSRSCADKIIGYRLSGIARDNVGARSVGRCQSAGLKLLVEREEEIRNFKPETYFDLYLHFAKNNNEFTAKYIGTESENIKNLPTLDHCKAIDAECKKSKYTIKNITYKDSLENPKAPFITSSYQQEVSKRLGISVKYAMDCAQRLFEGINVNGKHVALITYHRTDAATLAPEFQDAAKKYILANFGESYYAAFKAGKKTKNAQEAHEGIRPVDINMTPDKLKTLISDERLLKIYDIIWKRSVACCMKPAIIANTEYLINNGKHYFNMTSKELKFDGYRKIYDFGKDDSSEDEIIKETFVINEILQNTSLEALEKTTKPSPRFTEASFIRELEKRGVGRPSTYSNILSVLLDKSRGYCDLEDKNLIPTDLGIKLSHFLDNNFSDVISVDYTAKLEEELDEISLSKKSKLDFLTSFYTNLEESIQKVSKDKGENIQICPQCGGKMVYRKGKYGPFLSCGNYPSCKYIKSLKKN